MRSVNVREDLERAVGKLVVFRSDTLYERRRHPVGFWPDVDTHRHVGRALLVRVHDERRVRGSSLATNVSCQFMTSLREKREGPSNTGRYSAACDFFVPGLGDGVVTVRVFSNEYWVL